VDWLHFSKDVEAIMRASWASADTVLLGRKTWEWASSQAGPDDPSVTGVTSYVFPRTLTSIPDKKAQLITSDAGGFVRKAQGGPRQGHHRDERRQLRDLAAEGRRSSTNRAEYSPVLLGAGPQAFSRHRRANPTRADGMPSARWRMRGSPGVRKSGRKP
jgi:hypothetical protein